MRLAATLLPDILHFDPAPRPTNVKTSETERPRLYVAQNHAGDEIPADDEEYVHTGKTT
jgi:hypothetical protein